MGRRMELCQANLLGMGMVMAQALVEIALVLAWPLLAWPIGRIIVCLSGKITGDKCDE